MNGPPPQIEDLHRSKDIMPKYLPISDHTYNRHLTTYPDSPYMMDIRKLQFQTFFFAGAQLQTLITSQSIT